MSETPLPHIHTHTRTQTTCAPNKKRGNGGWIYACTYVIFLLDPRHPTRTVMEEQRDGDKRKAASSSDDEALGASKPSHIMLSSINAHTQHCKYRAGYHSSPSNTRHAGPQTAPGCHLDQDSSSLNVSKMFLQVDTQSYTCTKATTRTGAMTRADSQIQVSQGSVSPSGSSQEDSNHHVSLSIHPLGVSITKTSRRHTNQLCIRRDAPALGASKE